VFYDNNRSCWNLDGLPFLFHDQLDFLSIKRIILPFHLNVYFINYFQKVFWMISLVSSRTITILTFIFYFQDTAPTQPISWPFGNSIFGNSLLVDTQLLIFYYCYLWLGWLTWLIRISSQNWRWMPFVLNFGLFLALD